MRKLLLIAALAISLVFAEVRAAPGPADIGTTSVLVFLQGLNQKTRQSAEQAMGPGFILGIPAQDVTTLATAATETDTKAVSEKSPGMARVIAADQASDTLTSLDFGTVSVGQSATRKLTVRNTGTAVLSVNMPSTKRPFRVVSPTASFTVNPGGQRRVTVRFRPKTAGPQSGVLRIASNDPGAATVSITLQGVGLAPHIVVAPAALDFGNVSVGQSASRELTVRNTGTAVLSVTGISSPNPRFSVVSPPGPFQVVPNDQQPVTVTVRFSPTTGGVHNGELRIASNDPVAATVSIPLRGVGVEVPRIEVTPAPLNFGAVCVQQSASRGLTVRNTGTAVLSVTGISGPNPPFGLVSPPAVPFQLAPTAGQGITVRFSPTTDGAQNNVLSIASNDPGAATVSITLQGSGEPKLRICNPLQRGCECEQCGCRFCISANQECP